MRIECNTAPDGSSGPPACSSTFNKSGGLRVVSGLKPTGLLISAAFLAATVCLSIAQTNPHQSRTTSFGSSGGNINDISKAFCCSGTLGSMVKDSSNAQYILSNNHVLADSDQATAGEDISKPGLTDNNCGRATIVGDSA